jgi:hypothetical protein
MPDIVTLCIADIVLDPELQPRVEINADIVLEYAQKFVDGVVFPPPVVYDVNGEKLLSDGWHRIRAYQHLHRKNIEVELRSGTRLDALTHALEHNTKHGLPFTRDDIRRAIDIYLKTFKRLGDRAIARRLGVSPTTVGTRRKLLAEAGRPRNRLGGVQFGQRHPAPLSTHQPSEVRVPIEPDVTDLQETKPAPTPNQDDEAAPEPKLHPAYKAVAAAFSAAMTQEGHSPGSHNWHHYGAYVGALLLGVQVHMGVKAGDDLAELLDIANLPLKDAGLRVVASRSPPGTRTSPPSKARAGERRGWRDILRDGEPSGYRIRAEDGDASGWSYACVGPDGRPVNQAGHSRNLEGYRHTVASLLLGEPQVVDDKYVDADGEPNALWTRHRTLADVRSLAEWLGKPHGGLAGYPDLLAMLAETERQVRERIAVLERAADA